MHVVFLSFFISVFAKYATHDQLHVTPASAALYNFWIRLTSLSELSFTMILAFFRPGISFCRNHLHQLFTHVNGANHQRFTGSELINARLSTLDIPEYAVNIGHNISVARQQAVICINPGCFSLRLPVLTKPYWMILLRCAFYKTKLGVYLYIWQADQYFHAFHFEHLFPCEIGFFIEPCP